MAVIFVRITHFAGAVLLALQVTAVPAFAGAPPLGLREVVERAVAESHQVKAGGFDVVKAEAGVRKARALRYLPELKLKLEGGLVPAARGTVVSSPDTSSEVEDLGPFYRANLTFVQPLWTFGRLDAADDLARGALTAQQARRDLTGANVALDAARAYWVLAAAARGEAIARSMRRDFDKLQQEVEKRLADETSGVNASDLLEVKANSFSIDSLFLNAVEARSASADILRQMLSLPGDEEPPLVNEPPPLLAIDESQTVQAVARALEAHPEIRTLAAATKALAAKVELERQSRNPIVFLGGGVGYAHAGNRDKQDNPWVSDDFNYTRVSLELGVSWDANLYRKSIDVSEIVAEQRALLEQLELLRTKVGIDARKALREALRTRALLDSARVALKAATSRLRLVLDNWETGIGEVGDVIDAYEKYYKLCVEEPQREYELNAALARLGFVLGDVNLYLGWVHDGKVSL